MTTNRRGFLGRLIRAAATVATAAAGLAAGHWLLGKRRVRYPVNRAQYAPPPTRLIRPPGAVDEARFLAGCIRCYRCQDACDIGAIRFFGESAGRNYHTPYVDPAVKACTLCMKCTRVCPTGVLKPLEIEDKAKVKMGTVELDIDRCLSYKAKARYNERAARWEVKQKPSLDYEPPEATPEVLQRRGACGECYDWCPLPKVAIDREPGEFLAPLVFPDACVGCGLCEEICRQVVRGDPAIRVIPIRREACCLGSET